MIIKEWVEDGKLPWNKINVSRFIVHLHDLQMGDLLSESLEFTKELFSQVVRK
jgi:hypothetical protein